MYVMLVVSFCVDLRTSFVTMSNCLPVVNHTTKGEGELFTGKLVSRKTRGGLCEPKDVIVIETMIGSQLRPPLK